MQRTLKARDSENASNIADFLWKVKTGEYEITDVASEGSQVKIDYKKT